MKAFVIGDGGWGTALGLVLQRNGHQVAIWGPFADYLDEVRRTRENRKFLPGVDLPEPISLTSDERAAAESELVVIAVPSRYFVDVLQRFRSCIPASAMVLSVTKGLSKDGHERMSELASEVLGRDDVAALSGPSHAEEVARDVPTAVVAACRDRELASRIQQTFSARAFRVYTSDDVIGVELGGALKNVIAIAAGVSDGIGFGDNTKAALMTRGLAEMSRLGCAMGAKPRTFAGLSGIGDLIVTAMSRLSRNRGVGERLGHGEKAADILAGMEQVAEGVWTCVSARILARDLGIEVPITDEVHAIVHEGKDPRRAVQDLLSRDPKPEV